MYGRRTSTNQQDVSNKNPARVSGGLKGQGQDHLVMVSEDGLETQVPTQRYVNSLEEQIRKQRGAISVLERKLTRCETSIEQLKGLLNRS
jgi:hypothetical protein